MKTDNRVEAYVGPDDGQPGAWCWEVWINGTCEVNIGRPSREEALAQVRARLAPIQVSEPASDGWCLITKGCGFASCAGKPNQLPDRPCAICGCMEHA